MTTSSCWHEIELFCTECVGLRTLDELRECDLCGDYVCDDCVVKHEFECWNDGVVAPEEKENDDDS